VSSSSSAEQAGGIARPRALRLRCNAEQVAALSDAQWRMCARALDAS